jgi:voltage-gated potassium channel Kch
VIEAARLLFATEFIRLRARRASGHTVVCGDSLVAQAVTERLTGSGERVVRIVRPGESAARRRNLLLLPGDRSRSDTLRSAGVQRAAALYACSSDTSTDLAVALAAAGLNQRRAPLEVHVQVDDPELCLALQARRFGLPLTERVGVNFFNWHELAARTLVRREPITQGHADRTRVMVVGMSWFGRALIVELARQWRFVHRSGSLEVIVVDQNAAAAVDRLRRLYPFTGETCRFTAHDRDVAQLLDGDLPDHAPHRVYLCCDDEEIALKLALTMDHFWHGGPRSVIVRLGRLGGLSRAFHDPGAELLDPVGGTIHLFDALVAGSDRRLVEDGLTERLARTLHEQYVRRRMAEGASLGDTPAMVPWADVSEEVRSANRAQAVHIGPKLHSIGCALAPNPVWGPAEVLDATAVEHLARWEHDRWAALMRSNGWRHGAERDDANRLHPDLVSWESLPERAKEKDREVVRGLPDTLSEAGFRIVRVNLVPDRPGDGAPSADGRPTLDDDSSRMFH